MNWSRIWPWGSPRAKKAPLRRQPSIARLALERLEDRLVPSTTTEDALYQAWRQQQYTVDDLPASNANDIAQISTIDYQAVNNSFGSLIGLPSVFGSTPYRGDGYSVVVIDTGIDYRHTDLGGGFGAGKRVIAGWDFVNNDADPLDDNGHGTHVAGIIGSSSLTYSGVAPNVNLIALKVLDQNGSGTFGAVEDALKWVAANQAKYNIVSINLSLGAGNYTTNPYTFLDDEFTALRNQGVFIAVAAGNSFYSYNSQVGLDFPAVDPLVASVGAVWSGNFGPVAWGSGARDYTTAADRVASFTQRGPGLSIMAPGAIINSTYLNNTYKTMAGTSMASPVVAAAAAILHQAMDARGLTANQDSILGLMRSTAVNVVDGDDENDNVVNTGLTFKRLDLGAALGALGTPANSAPVMATIGAKAVSPGKSTIVTLSATDANNDPITFSAQVVGSSTSLAYQLKQQLSLSFNGSYFLNSWGQNEKWLTGASGAWYCILPNGELRRWTGSMATTLQPANLLATFDASYYADPSLLYNAQAAGGTQPTLTVSGNRLTIQAPAGVSGSFQIRVTASDGLASTQQVFTLNITNSAPVLQAIADQSITPGKTRTISLSATDADGDALTYSARIVSAFATQAYQFKQQLGLSYTGSYLQNYWGLNEKWMTGSNGEWYCVLPNGEFRRFGGSAAATMKATNLLATLPTAVYFDPSLLWNAQPPVAGTPTLTLVGNQLTIQAPAGVTNVFQVEVTVSDGTTTTKQLFNLTVKNTPPVLSTVTDKTLAPGRSQTITLSAIDADGDALTFSARVVSALAAQAYQLKQQLGLTYTGSYLDNYWGLNEKWMAGPNGAWYCILPNGEFRRFGGSAAGTMKATNLLATLSTAAYDDPSLLWNAQTPVAGSPTLTLIGNQLTIQAPAGVTDVYQIEVTVSDGMATTKQTFNLLSKNSPPVLAAIGDKTAAPGKSQTVTLSASDADSDALTYSAVVVGTLSAQAYQFKQQLSLSYTGSYLQNYWGLGEKWMAGSNGTWYCILPNGEFRRFGGSAAGTMKATNLLATLPTAAYDDPALLWNAQAPIASTPSLTLVGNQLTIQAPAGVAEVYQIEVRVSDGLATTKRQFNFVVKNSPPVLQPITTKTVAAGAALGVTLSATDPDGDALTYSARIVTSLAGQAYQLKQQLSLRYDGSYYQNLWGLNEKWIAGPNASWYCILPNGELRRWASTMTAAMQSSNLVATFDASYYANPSLLWDAKPAGASPTLTMVGNQLTVTAPAGLANTYQIEVSVSDGMNVVTQTFTLRVTATNPPSGLNGDFNGDGRQDSAEFKTDGSLWISIANANGSVTTQFWTQWSASADWTDVAALDVNGDGRTDIVGLYKNGKYYIAYSTGTSFTTQLWNSATPPTGL